MRQNSTSFPWRWRTTTPSSFKPVSSVTPHDDYCRAIRHAG
jgi:hypothetical protein